MINFSISKQIRNELKEFYSTDIQLAAYNKNETVRFVRGPEKGTYMFNQARTLAIIDLYHNSKFESGEKDSLGFKKIFLNVGKFRTSVAAKQIDIDTKDIAFIPDDYANPWASFFLQKEFKEYAKESYFGDLLNDIVENYPKYGTVVLKKVNGRVEFVPLQNLRNEQTAKDLQTSSYVIEEHPNMKVWEILKMNNWNTEGLDLRMDKEYCVYERYGYVPLGWLKKVNGEKTNPGDYEKYVDAMVICSIDMSKAESSDGLHIFYANKITKRPYLEKHFDKQHGRWLGCGTMEDLVENQQAKNMIINLLRRSIMWASKKVLQSTNQETVAKNLLKDVSDGEILEVGMNGEIKQVDLTSKSLPEFNNFLQEFEKNADQKAFTYEVATGESMPSGTPFRLGIILSGAVNTYFNLKREKLGLFLKRVIIEFLLPEFIRNMRNVERIINYFSDEPGFNALKEAAMQVAKEEFVKATLLSGKAVDSLMVEQAIEPMRAVSQLYFKLPKGYYDNIKYKFDIVITGESIDIPKKVETLTTIYQMMINKNDPRAEKVLERIAALTGENINVFNTEKPPMPIAQPINQPNQNLNGNQPTDMEGMGQQ